MEWDARIVGGVNLDGIFQLTLLSLSALFCHWSWGSKVQDHR